MKFACYFSYCVKKKRDQRSMTILISRNQINPKNSTEFSFLKTNINWHPEKLKVQISKR